MPFATLKLIIQFLDGTLNLCKIVPNSSGKKKVEDYFSFFFPLKDLFIYLFGCVGS